MNKYKLLNATNKMWLKYKQNYKTYRENTDSNQMCQNRAILLINTPLFDNQMSLIGYMANRVYGVMLYAALSTHSYYPNQA